MGDVHHYIVHVPLTEPEQFNLNELFARFTQGWHIHNVGRCLIPSDPAAEVGETVRGILKGCSSLPEKCKH